MSTLRLAEIFGCKFSKLIANVTQDASLSQPFKEP